jgi:hypothetical protein
VLAKVQRPTRQKEVTKMKLYFSESSSKEGKTLFKNRSNP